MKYTVLLWCEIENCFVSGVGGDWGDICGYVQGTAGTVSSCVLCCMSILQGLPNQSILQQYNVSSQSDY